MARRFTYFLIALLAVGCAGCKSSKPSVQKSMQETTPSLIETIASAPTRWHLSAIKEKALSAHSTDSPVWIEINPEASLISGKLGCNSLSASYTIEAPNKMSVGDIITTKMMCPDEIMKVEQSITQLLPKVTCIGGDATTLLLMQEDKVLLRFVFDSFVEQAE